MTDYGFPVLYAISLWWFGTGVVLYLDNLPQRTFRWTMLGGIVVLAVAIFVFALSSLHHGVAAAYLAFSSGVVIWGVLEMSYFTGFLTGPRKQPCPPDCRGWRRFWLAVLTSLYHELTVVATAAFLIMVAWDQPNLVGVWTFVVLWLMRWSAKLNLFFGVPNLNEEWLPEQLRFLKTYMPTRGMNLLFPISITVSTVIAVLIILEALAPETESAASVRLMLAATLLALAILEHWFLVLPLPDEALWAWAIPKRDDASSGDDDLDPPQNTSMLRGSLGLTAMAVSSSQATKLACLRNPERFPLTFSLSRQGRG